MKWTFLGIFWLISLGGYAQQAGNTVPPYKRNPTLPPLELTLPNKQLLTSADLKKEPVLIMYFSPTCDHCIRQMKEMQKKLADFRKIQVVMATYQPMEELEAFIREYGLAAQPNFITGRDTKFLLPSFYKIQSMPYFALYNKKGALITTFEGNTPVEKLLKAFR